MAKTIEGIPEYISREQYLDLFHAAGVTPDKVQELRLAPDGIHAIVFHFNDEGYRELDRQNPNGGYIKHRVFIPIRNSEDETKTTRVKPVKGK